MSDPCPICGRPQGFDDAECDAGPMYRNTVTRMDCERAGRLRAEASLTRIAGRLAWSREWWDGDLAGEVIGIMDRDAATLEAVAAEVAQWAEAGFVDLGDDDTTPESFARLARAWVKSKEPKP